MLGMDICRLLVICGSRFMMMNLVVLMVKVDKVRMRRDVGIG